MRHLTLRTTPPGRTPLRASFLYTERASPPANASAPHATPPAREQAPQQTTPQMAQAADTTNPPTAAHAAVINAAAALLAARTPNPRILRARARLRATHRRRFQKESARNK